MKKEDNIDELKKMLKKIASVEKELELKRKKISKKWLKNKPDKKVTNKKILAKKAKEELLKNQNKLDEQLKKLNKITVDIEKKQKKAELKYQSSKSKGTKIVLVKNQLSGIKKEIIVRKQSFDSLNNKIEEIKTQIKNNQTQQFKQLKEQHKKEIKTKEEPVFNEIPEIDDDEIVVSKSVLKHNRVKWFSRSIKKTKGKIALVAIACSVLIILGGLSPTMLYGTEYIQSKSKYSYSVANAATWWNCSWAYCKKITIDHSKVETDQTDFTVLLYEAADADLATHAQTNGNDIAFTNIYNTTQYSHEIEKYDSATGELTVWVKVASLSSTTDTILYMYYGNPTCTSQQNVTDTWDSDFIMVQHLNESSMTPLDSTTNNNDGSNNGATYNSSSKIDGGYDFGGSADVNIGNDSSLNITSSITLEGWVKDPPIFINNKPKTSVSIVDKKEEQRLILPGKKFTVERTISTDKETTVIFAALFSNDINLNDMKVENENIFEGIYERNKPENDYELQIEKIRKILPKKLQELDVIGYSKLFRVNGLQTIDMYFDVKLNSKVTDGRISYLVISSDGSYDYESTTHWNSIIDLNYTAECYDNETKILTENGWKYFYQLKDEKVATLNHLTCELEWQKPLDKTVFEYNGTMYSIKTENGDLLVSPIHKVYAKVYDSAYLDSSSNSIISRVLNTNSLDCFLNNLSLDQIGQPSLSARAKKSMSLTNSMYSFFVNWSAVDSALGKADEYSSKGTNSTFNARPCFSFLNSDFELEVFSINSDEYLLISSNAYSGEKNSTDLFSIFLRTEPFQKKVNNTLESTTSFIYKSPFFFNSFTRPLRDLRSVLTAHSLTASSSLSFFNISSFQDSCFTFPSIDFLINPDQFISENLFINSFVFCDTDNVIDTISKPHVNKHNYVKIFKDFDLISIQEAYGLMKQGKNIVFMDKNGNEIQVESIMKENYSGKIYDVDVENDITLVRRFNRSGLWSGNSNTYKHYNSDVKNIDTKIVDKREEQRLILPGKKFTVKRTISTNKETTVVFVAFYTPGIQIEKMTNDETNVLEDTYTAGKPQTDTEKNIEKIRQKLPEKIQELEFVAYSKPITIKNLETIKMNFNPGILNQDFDNRISYLVISSDDDFDYETTTHLKDLFDSIDWKEPKSISKFVKALRNLIKDIEASEEKFDKNKPLISESITKLNDELFSKKLTVRPNIQNNNVFKVNTSIPEIRYPEQVNLSSLLEGRSSDVDDYELLDTNGNDLFDIIQWNVSSSNSTVEFETNIDLKKVEYVNHQVDTINNYNGTKVDVMYVGVKNYYDEVESIFKPIDLSVESLPDGSYKNEKNNFKTFYENKAGKDFLIYNVSDSHITYSLDSQSFANMNYVDAIVDKNTITYPDIYNGIDLKYTISSKILLEEFIVKNQSTAKRIAGLDKPEIKMDFKIENAYFIEESDGSISFYDKSTNEKLWTFPKPVMYELDYPHINNYGIYYEINKTSNGYTISKVVDQEGIDWLTSPGRYYPIVIDATSTIYYLTTTNCNGYKSLDDDSTMPPLDPESGDYTQYTAAQDSEASDSDNNYNTFDSDCDPGGGICTSSVNLWHKYRITQDENYVYQLYCRWDGYESENWHAGDLDDIYMYAWNDLTNSWEEKDSEDYSASETPMTYTISSNVGNYIESDGDVHTGIVGDQETKACFLNGTNIAMADNSYKNIENIKVGDMVKSYNQTTGEIVDAKVTKIFHHEMVEMGEYYLIINKNIRVTPEHMFYTDKGWIPAETLEKGDRLYSIEKEYIPITSIKKIYEKAKTYNFHVEEHNVYYANDMLVHNFKCPLFYSYDEEKYIFEDYLLSGFKGKENEGTSYNYLEHMNNSKAKIRYLPGEIGYMDWLKLKIIDTYNDTDDNNSMTNRTFYLNPTSLEGGDLSLLLEEDEQYLLFSEEHQEYFIEFEQFPELEEGWNREIGVLAHGYFAKIDNSTCNSCINREHHTTYEDYTYLRVYYYESDPPQTTMENFGETAYLGDVGNITGGSTDDNQVSYVSVSIFNDTDNMYWKNGFPGPYWDAAESFWTASATDGSFNSADEDWYLVPSCTFIDGKTYQICAKARDDENQYDPSPICDSFVFSDSNNPPVIREYTPENGSTEVCIRPTCTCEVGDEDGDNFYVQFWENSTGSWTKRQSNLTAQERYEWNYSQASSAGTEYWWKVLARDCYGNNSPNANWDPESAWSNEANAYDEDTGTYATCTVAERALILNQTAANCGGVWIYASKSEGGEEEVEIESITIDIREKISDSFLEIYTGDLEPNTWRFIENTESVLPTDGVRITVNDELAEGKTEAWIKEVYLAKSDEDNETFHFTTASAGNDDPYADNLQIHSEYDFTLDNLTGTYTYNDNESDAETGSTLNWYESSDNSSWTALGVNDSWLDSNNTNESWYYKFEVTPRNANGDGTSYNSSVFEITALNESAGTYSWEYDEAENLTIGNGGSLTISGGAVDIDGNVTLENGGTLAFGSQDPELGSLTVGTGCTCTGSSGTIYITSENTSSGYAVNLDGTFTNNSGTIEINTDPSTSTNIDLNPDEGGGTYTVVVDLQGAETATDSVILQEACTISYYLLLDDGIFDTNNNAVTVSDTYLYVNNGATFDGEGDTADHSFNSLEVVSGGTFKGASGSKITITGEAGGYAVDLDGAFTNNSNTIEIQSNIGGGTGADLIAGSGGVYDLIINAGDIIAWAGNTEIGDDLTVSAGTFQPLNAGDTLSVIDDVTVSGGTLGGNSASGTWTLGTLTESSGTIDATTGTIFITDETAGGYALDLDGTFTDNTGTVEINTAADTNIDIAATGNLYKLIIDTTSAYTITSDAAATIDDNITIQTGTLSISDDLSTNDMQIDAGACFDITGDKTFTMNNAGTLTQNGNFNITSGDAITVNLTGTTTTFNLTNATNIALYETPSNPPDPTGWTNMGKHINITELTGGATFDLNITYDDSDYGSITESTIIIKEYNWTDTWSDISDTGVNTAGNYAWANSVTDFSTFGPFGQEPSPNNAPTLSNEIPTNNSLHIPTTNTTINCTITDQDETDTMNWTIHSEIGSNSGSTASSNTSISTSITGNLTAGATYTWYVNVSDGTDTTRAIYQFTVNNPVVISFEIPTNQSGNIPLSNTTINCTITDADSDTMNWTIHSEIGSNSSNNNQTGDSIYASISGNLSSQTTYTWYVNITDGYQYTRAIYTFNTTNNRPILNFEIPTNQTTGLTLTTSTVNCTVTDSDNDNISWTLESNIGSNSGTATNTTNSNSTSITTSISGNLSSGTTYTWYVNATDGDLWIRESYQFTTNNIPVLSNEIPTNQSTDVPITNTTINVTITDDDNDYMNWTIESEIGSNSSNNNQTGDSIYASISGNLSNGITYTWYVNVSDGTDTTNAIYQFTTIGTNKEIISKEQNTYSLEMNPAGTTITGYINGNTVTTTGIDTNWHYVSLTFDGNNMNLYVDGELANTEGLVASINTNENNLQIGDSFTGTLDEIRISDTPRTTAWINTTYQNTNNPTTFATFGTQIGALNAWSYRKKIWINSTMINDDLPYFPILISTTDNDLKNNADTTGNDIIFTNSTVSWTTGSYNDRLPHEIEKWESSTGELVAWVNVTSLSSTTNTSIYMYYGSSICTTDRTNTTGVWDSNYVMIHHLQETADPHEDSSSSNNDGNESGGVNQSADEEKIDGADWFDGNNDFVNCGNGTSLNIRNAVTIEAWIKMDERPNKDDWYDCTGKANYSLYLYGADNTETILGAYFWIDGVEVDLWGEGVVDINPNNGWAHCVITFNGTDIKAYVNGQLDFTYNNPGTIDDSSASNLTIGANWDETNPLYGSFDEVRISNTNRSAAWINTTYNNTNNPSSFLAFGVQEIQNVAPTQSSPSPSNGATGQSLNPPLNITVGDLNGDAMDVTFRTNASGSWGDIDTNSSVYNGTYQQTPSNMNSYNTQYWWSVNVTDGTLWNNQTYSFTTNALPVLSNPIPTNGSTDISLWPECNITVSDSNGGTVDVYFYENTTGSWVCNQTNSSIDVTAAQNVVWLNYTNASTASTKYNWSVNVSDGIGWTNETYHFTTAASPYLYTLQNNVYVFYSDFIPSATSFNNTYKQFIDITRETEIINGKVLLKITEELDETTYLDRIYLRIDSKQTIEIEKIKANSEQFFTSHINKQLLRYSDKNYLILNKGDEYHLEFNLPNNYDKIEFVAEGHYIKNYK